MCALNIDVAAKDAAAAASAGAAVASAGASVLAHRLAQRRHDPTTREQANGISKIGEDDLCCCGT